MGDSIFHVVLSCVVGLCSLVVGIVGFIVHRSFAALDEATDEIAELKTKVAILLDRDRRKRLQDYEQERDDT